jgi:single-stranded-DNA-specific exonuclease
MKFELIQNTQHNSSALVQVLLNRGFQFSDIMHYLNTTDNDIIEPASIEHMKEGAELLLKHWKNGDKIFVQADTDCDGYTSAAIFINYMNKLDEDYAQNNITYRVHHNKHHGIIPSTVPDDIGLVVIPDASSEEYLQHEELHERGIDILIIDHHNAQKYSEYACVINNKLCDYGNKDLSGATMVYKFCSYLDKILNVHYADLFLDLALLGMVADVMPITNFETRRLLDKMTINNEFLTYLFEADNYRNNGVLNVHTLAWSFAPVINSITRFGSEEERLLVFEALLDFKASEKIPSTKRGAKGKLEKRYIEAARICKNVKSAQDRAKKSWADELENVITQENLLDNKIILIKNQKSSEDTRNLSGLVATILASKYDRPALILSPVQEEDGIHWAGSMRNPGYPIGDFQKFALDSGLIDWCHGHDNAAGISIPEENLDAFVQYTNDQLKDYNFEKCYLVDRIYDITQIDEGDVASLADAESLWGTGIEEPLIAITNIPLTLDTISYSPKKTFQTVLTPGLSAMKTFFSEEEWNKVQPRGKRKYMDVVGYCKRSIGFGESLRIDIVDYNIYESKYWDF